MPVLDKRIDAYIAKAEPFARPILVHLRKLVHQACPDVEETIKWGFASFDYKGPFCTMASFKKHAVFGFWKSSLLKDPGKHLGVRANKGGEAMGNMGRITDLQDLPPDKVIIDFIHQAKKLNDKGIKIPARKKAVKQEVLAPDDFLTLLRKNKKTWTVFEAFSESQKREYILWITEAKTEETRARRMKTAAEWISEGKIRNWKYVKK